MYQQKELEIRVNNKLKKDDKSNSESKPNEKNKTLKQDMGSKLNFSKDNPLSEEEFIEQKVKEGIIKPQEYKESTIEVNGKTYNQPLSYEEVVNSLKIKKIKYQQNILKDSKNTKFKTISFNTCN